MTKRIRKGDKFYLINDKKKKKTIYTANNIEGSYRDPNTHWIDFQKGNELTCILYNEVIKVIDK
jgi:frataxin-like iron-binding protein CyaY